MCVGVYLLILYCNSESVYTPGDFIINAKVPFLLNNYYFVKKFSCISATIT